MRNTLHFPIKGIRHIDKIQYNITAYGRILNVYIVTSYWDFQDFNIVNFVANFSQRSLVRRISRKVFLHNKDKGYVLPTVYQSIYNLVARESKDMLFPPCEILACPFMFTPLLQAASLWSRPPI